MNARSESDYLAGTAPATGQSTEYESLLPHRELSITPRIGEMMIGPYSTGESISDVARILDHPSGYARGEGLDGSRFPLSSSEEYAATHSARTARLDTSKKIYNGPVYLQGREPTCMAWAVAHSILATGQPPSPELMRVLLDSRLSSTSVYADNMNVFSLGAALADAGAAIDYDIPYIARAGKYTPNRVGHFIKRTLDNGSAIIACIDFRDGHDDKRVGHAVSVVGYDIADNGSMALQIIDSARGERVLSLSELTDEMNKHSQMSPPLAIISPLS